MRKLILIAAAGALLTSCATTRTKSHHEEERQAAAKIDSSGIAESASAQVKQATHENEQTIEIEYELPLRDSITGRTVRDTATTAVFWNHGPELPRIPTAGIKKLKFSFKGKSAEKDSSTAQEKTGAQVNRNTTTQEKAKGGTTTRKGASLFARILAIAAAALAIAAGVYVFVIKKGVIHV